jgi:CRP/FNR family transcriptional regulator, cyclic AMP receptor protein
MQTSAQDPKQVDTSLAAMLAGYPFTVGMPAHELAVLVENAMRVSYPAGETIFREGDPANRFYLIESGAVALEARATRKQTECLQIIRAGEVLGWSWLFPPYTWHFDARTIEPTSAIFLYGSRVRQICEEQPEIGYDLMKRISQVVIKRLQGTRNQLAEALRSLDRRPQAHVDSD